MAEVPQRDPKYSKADLWPPGSVSSSYFPPAAFHPVYLGNFYCSELSEMAPRVQQYFASKGLLVRMVFVRSGANDIHRNYQHSTKLYECLAYFTREEDALDAVRYLHRDKYFGHRLNIYPGRTPVVMNPEQTVIFKVPEILAKMSPCFFEDHIVETTKCTVKSTKRVSKKNVAVQFECPQMQLQALREYKHLLASQLPAEMSQQQSFLEKDVIGEIKERIQNKPFMAMCPEKHVLEALYAGTKPTVPMDWAEYTPIPSHRFTEPNEGQLFNVARQTLQSFGVTCNFLSQFKGKVRLENFLASAARLGRMYNNNYHKRMKQTFKAKRKYMEKLGQPPN